MSFVEYPQIDLDFQDGGHVVI